MATKLPALHHKKRPPNKYKNAQIEQSYKQHYRRNQQSAASTRKPASFSVRIKKTKTIYSALSAFIRERRASTATLIAHSVS